MSRLLCVGVMPYDVVHLLTIARRAEQRLGLEPVFITLAQPESAPQVREQVSDAGFAVVDRPLAATRAPSIRNPVVRFRQLRDENRRLIDDALSDIRPDAVLVSVNPPPGLFLDEAARRGIPGVLLQLFFWGNRSFHAAWIADDRQLETRDWSRWYRFRRELRYRLEEFYGVGASPPWAVHRATIAVQGRGLQRRLLAEGIPAENVVVTGNPLVDELFELRSSREEARDRVFTQLGLSPNARLLTYFRGHEDRAITVDRQRRAESQVDIIHSLRAAAPDAQVVVKIHPREGAVERAFVGSIDRDVFVVGDEFVTNELIVASDVVVGMMSTTLLQAVALDRPTVSAFLWDGRDYWRDATNWSGVERVTSADALTEAVRLHLTDPAHQAKWKARRDSFTAEEFLLDGNGTDHVVDLLERMLRARADDRS